MVTLWTLSSPSWMLEGSCVWRLANCHPSNIVPLCRPPRLIQNAENILFDSFNELISLSRLFILSIKKNQNKHLISFLALFCTCLCSPLPPSSLTPPRLCCHRTLEKTTQTKRQRDWREESKEERSKEEQTKLKSLWRLWL